MVDNVFMSDEPVNWKVFRPPFDTVAAALCFCEKNDTITSGEEQAMKRDEAVKLWHAAFGMLSRDGKIEQVSGGLELIMLRIGSLHLAMRTPLQKMPEVRSFGCDQAIQLLKPKNPLPYGIDIWAGKKVFSVEWADGHPLTIISFRRGTWEGELLSAEAAPSRDDIVT